METQKSKKVIYGSYEDLRQRKHYTIGMNVFLLIAVILIMVLVFWKFPEIFPTEESPIGEWALVIFFFWSLSMALLMNLAKLIASPLPKKKDSE